MATPTRRSVSATLTSLTLLAAAAGVTPAFAQKPFSGELSPVFQSPAGTAATKVVPGGITILPNGRRLTPKGQRLYTGANLWNVAVRPDGKVAVGFCDNLLVVYSLPHRAGSVPRRIPFKDHGLSGVFTRDGSRLVVSDGDAGGGIAVFESKGWETAPANPGKAAFVTAEQKPVLHISANVAPFDATYITDLVLGTSANIVFGVDVAHQRVVTFDLAAGSVIASEPAGREPYSVTLSANGKSLFVANIGLFNYKVIPPPAPGSGGSERGLSRPPFAFPSRESEVGVRQEGRAVPGLGSPYVPDAQSVWKYDVSLPAKPRVVAKAKAGLLIHAPADGGKAAGGSAPNKLLLRRDRLYVSNANNDTVQEFDARSLTVRRTIKLSPSPLVARLRGTIPSGMALNKSGTRLYVCESGLNAVAVIDTAKGTVLGRIPTGWFPTQIALSPDDRKLFIATQKGLGRGPRGDKQRRTPADERFGLEDMPGMLDVVTVPDDKTLASWTVTVKTNNGIINRRAAAAKLPPSPVPRLPGVPSKQIEYVVFITKENHTFDGIFGELKSRGAAGEPDYAEFGRKGWIREKGKAERVPIMPNHLNLADQFAISDNFYMEPQASGDGHRWLVGVYPSLWTTRVFYSGWNFKRSNEAPGRLVSFGSDGSQIPEDYLENGSLWEHLQRGGISFRNYGEGYELPQTDEGVMTNKTGTYYQVNYPMPKALFDNTCFEFPAYNNNIPDIARADWFREDIEKYRKEHGGKLPRFINIAICNDHGTSPNAARGYPYVSSYMADNDLALGRIVEYLSQQSEWRKMAIFVTQDDSGGDDDHVDRHRSYVLAISPYARRGGISHDHGSIMSIIKTIYLIFGLGPNNQFDALATDLSDLFTSKADFTPYKHVPSDPRVFKPEETFDPSDPKFERRRREKPTVTMDDPEFVEELHEQRTRLRRPNTR